MQLAMAPRWRLGSLLGDTRPLISGGCCMLALTFALQYWPLFRPRRKALPPGTSGLPFLLGSSLMLFGDVGEWLRVMHKRFGPAFRALFFGTHLIVVDMDVYDRAFAKLDQTAALQPLWPTGFKCIVGYNGLQFMRGGSGPLGSRHRRMKRKVSDAFTPAELRSFFPRIEQIVRDDFELMVEETLANGHTTLALHCLRTVKRIILELTLGENAIDPALYLSDSATVLMEGMIAAPIDLGPLTAFGRAMAVRRSWQREVKKLIQDDGKEGQDGDPDGVANPELAHQPVLKRLAKQSKHGQGLTLEELQDLLIGLLLGGSLTTAETMQWLLTEVRRNPEWKDKLTQESRQMVATEGGLTAAWGSCPPEGSKTPCPLSLAAVYETLRLHCPVDVVLRTVDEDVDLGEGCGTVPAGWWVACHMTERGIRQGGTDFNPDRWVGKSYVSSPEVVAFGLGPHFCVGRTLALWELQTFLHVWLTSYEVEVLNDENESVIGMRRFKGGMPLKVRRK